MRDQLVKVYEGAVREARACAGADNFLGAALWRVLCRVIEELMAVGAC